MKNRSEVDEKYRWDLKTYYKNIKEFNNDLTFVKNNLKSPLSFENKLNNSDDIYNCLILNSSINLKLEKLYVYVNLKLKEDVTVTENQNLVETISSLAVTLSENTSFIDVEMIQNSNEFLLNLSKEKRFKNYKLYLKGLIKEKKHLLSKNEEKLLSSLSEFSDGFSEVFDKFENADVRFDDIENSNGDKLPLNQSNYYSYVQSADRVLRKNAYINLHKGFGNLNYTLSSNYINHIKKDNFYSKVRKYKNVLQASLYSEDVKNVVYYNLIKSVNENHQIMFDYYDIKKHELALDKIAIYDMAAPIYSIPNQNPTFEDAYDIVLKALKPMGEKYIALLKQARQNRWIDVFPNKGKDNGAFSWGAYCANPVVLLNYEYTINDIFTIAHELGHAMHSYFSNNHQPFETAGYEIFVAEVASTTNEMLLLRYLLNNTKNKDELKYYYDYFMRMVRTTIFRQTMFAEFEEKMHKLAERKIPLSADLLNSFYFELNKKYFGDDVELIPEIKYEWSRIPHFYNSFYVYKYATGLISAIIISEKIYNNEPDAVNNYLKFLSSGSTKSPVDLLKIAGVDLNNKETFDKTFKSIKIMLDSWKMVL